MRLVLTSLCATLLAASLASCGHSQVRDLGLGKVVVYRNGVAYFERRARTSGGEIKLTVPADKIDDFLKSLTVSDARTGESVPVSFPSRGGEGGALVDLVVLLPPSAPSEVILTYITEAPAWKPSYRVSLGTNTRADADGQVALEGWAIVDNTSGETWHDVMVGVGSSSALSFRYDLWSIRDVHREKLASDDRFAVAPPTGASPYREETAGAVITSLDDGTYNIPPTHPGNTLNQEYTRNIPVPGRTFEGALGSASGSSQENVYIIDGVNTSSLTFGSTGGAPPRRDKAAEKRAREAAERAQRELEARRSKFERNERNIAALARRLVSSGQAVVIEGYAAAGDADPQQSARDRANLVRNQLVDQGVAPARLKVRAVGVKGGQPAGVRLVADGPTTAAAGSAKSSDATARPVGESHFQSRTPISVRRGASVMVSILKDKTQGRVVYLFDPESPRGNSTFAFKAVRLKNPTDNTLEAGPVTVYSSDGFVGEGLTDPIPPRSVALIPFALDRQVVVEADSERTDRIAGLVKISRGVLTAEVRRVKKTRFKLTNRRQSPVTVFVKSTVPEGWELLDTPANTERLGTAHLLGVELEAGQTRTVSMEVATPLERTLDLRSDESFDMVAVFLRDSSKNEKLVEQMKPLLAMHRELANHGAAITSLRDRLVEYRVRMDELHIQIVSLKAVRSGGQLLRHLHRTLRDVSERVQAATIKVVGHQEEVMMMRIKFQDAIVDLTLPEPSTLAKKNAE